MNVLSSWVFLVSQRCGSRDRTRAAFFSIDLGRRSCVGLFFKLYYVLVLLQNFPLTVRVSEKRVWKGNLKISADNGQEI